jgi:hypothetical protein
MHVETDIISAVAELITADLSALPIEDHAEWRGFTGRDAQTFQDLFDELNWADLMPAVRAAADRLPEPADDEDEDEDNA